MRTGWRGTQIKSRKPGKEISMAIHFGAEQFCVAQTAAIALVFHITFLILEETWLIFPGCVMTFSWKVEIASNSCPEPPRLIRLKFALIVSELPFPNFFPLLHTPMPFLNSRSLLENSDLTERIDRGRGASGHPHLGGLGEVYICVCVCKCTPAHWHLLGANVTDCSWLHRLAHAPSLMCIIALPLSGAETNSHRQILVFFFSSPSSPFYPSLWFRLQSRQKNTAELFGRSFIFLLSLLTADNKATS